MVKTAERSHYYSSALSGKFLISGQIWAKPGEGYFRDAVSFTSGILNFPTFKENKNCFKIVRKFKKMEVTLQCSTEGRETTLDWVIGRLEKSRVQCSGKKLCSYSILLMKTSRKLFIRIEVQESFECELATSHDTILVTWHGQWNLKTKEIKPGV